MKYLVLVNGVVTAEFSGDAQGCVNAIQTAMELTRDFDVITSITTKEE